VTPGSVAFGEQVVGEPSGALPVTLRNQGTAPVQLDIRIAASTPGEFTVGTDRCSNAVLAPADDCVVEVVFRPVSTGLRSAQLILRNINANTTQSVALTGTGVETGTVPSSVSVSDPVNVAGSVAAGVGLRPARVEFGSQTVASSSRRQDVTLVNEGSESIRITSVAIDGGAPADFVIAADRCSDAVLPPAGRCAVVVVFQPRATGVRSARLVVANDGGGAARTTLLSGTGT
ncbi:MAG: choice-of-anchor D domain-containing protein, partial [Gemmatimonadota bacterium]